MFKTQNPFGPVSDPPYTRDSVIEENSELCAREEMNIDSAFDSSAIDESGTNVINSKRQLRKWKKRSQEKLEERRMSKSKI